MPARRRGRTNEKVLRPVHPNVGIAASYRKRLLRLLDKMARSYEHWLCACYRANEPVMAQDATPAAELKKTLEGLGKRWQKQWDSAAPELAAYFRMSVEKRSSAALRRILKDAGISVKFKMTPAMRDIAQAVVTENVSLIKSIPQQYHTQVEGMVMRSVTAGRDLYQLARDLQKQFGVTRRRAALIARDQNNKATAVFTRARQLEVGINEAIWLHSHGGREPRPTHIANDGNRYNVAEGWYDPDPKVRRRIWPGELINCRCVPKAIVKGFS